MRAVILRLRIFEDLLLKFDLRGGLFVGTDFRIAARIPLPTPSGHPEVNCPEGAREATLGCPPGGGDGVLLYYMVGRTIFPQNEVLLSQYEVASQ